MGSAGEVVGAIGVSVDVTERLNMQTRLLQAERLASMGTLSATVAHEINNPLAFVLGNLERVAELLSEVALCSASALAGVTRRVSEAREGPTGSGVLVRGLQTFSRYRTTMTRASPTDVHAVRRAPLEMADRNA